MKHKLPALAFATDALEPFLSAETFAYHHGKHHRGYVSKLNEFLAGSDLADLSLTEVVKRSDGALFNSAAQHFNHSFYWRCITPDGGKEPQGELLTAIERDCGSTAKLKDAFLRAAIGHFGSGWCWLVKGPDGKLGVRTGSDAQCPLVDGYAPVLTCDVWEHAYYLDYRNDRPRYVGAFWNAVNWGFAAFAFDRPEAVEDAILGRR
jgi:Fe-Mn family superoxide dismutase